MVCACVYAANQAPHHTADIQLTPCTSTPSITQQQHPTTQVGDSISCAVYDVEAGGVPLLTQRLVEEADDELAELAEELDQVRALSRVVCA